MYRILIVLISIYVSYLNFKIYDSYKLQTKVTQDFNNRNYQKENFIVLQNADIEFPNLTATAFPVYVLLANYHLIYGEIDKSINLLDKYQDVNPFLRAKESTKAEIYFRLGVRDSSYKYAKIAFENLPQNARHFQQYLTELTWRKDIDEINKVFLESKAKYNHEYWLFYFSAVINLKENNNKQIDSLANIALSKFPKNEQIKTIAGYILYGQENIKKSYQLNQEGISSFENSDFQTASTKFIEAAELNPLDYSFNENAGMSLIKMNDYERAIMYLKRSLNSKDKKDDGKTEYGLGLSFKEINQKIESCKYLKISMEKDYKQAFQLYSSTCY